MTTDLKAAHYVINNNYDYIKVKVLRKISRRLFGKGAFCCINWGDNIMTIVLLHIGLLNAEGDEHKKQVRFLLQDLFANCCLILQVAQNYGRSESFLARVFNV